MVGYGVIILYDYKEVQILSPPTFLFTSLQ
nr:MAG TPA: hypothetical protein [Caudoviricetes sp.]